jgi:lipopolysaccharide export system permease protein
MLTPFLVSLVVFTAVLFLARSLKLVDLIVNKDVPAGDILLLFSYLIPKFLELAIPMSLLLGVIVSFGRLSSDSEIVVMRAVGINLKRMAVPVFIFAFLCCLLTVTIGLWVRPATNFRLNNGVYEIAKTQATAGLVEGIFNDLGQMTIYAEHVQDKGSQLQNVIIADRRNPDETKAFFAKHGQFISNDIERTLTLRLYDGLIQMGSGLNRSITFFDINNFNLQQGELFDHENSKGKRSDEMYLHELTSEIAVLEGLIPKTDAANKERSQKRASYLVELHSRFAIPVSCLCVAFIALALGIQPSRGGHSWGAIVSVLAGVVVIIGYYLMLAILRVLGENMVIPPFLAAWLPNLIFFGLAFYLFKKVGSESWLAVSEAFGDLISRVVSKLGLKQTKIN